MNDEINFFPRRPPGGVRLPLRSVLPPLPVPARGDRGHVGPRAGPAAGRAGQPGGGGHAELHAHTHGLAESKKAIDAHLFEVGKRLNSELNLN